MLLQIYGAMLTEKQYGLLDDYYNNDLSLSEIAENYDITRQAVQEIVRKGEQRLLEYEQKLGIMKKTLNQEQQIQNILSQISKISIDATDKQVEKILKNVRKELINLNA